MVTPNKEIASSQKGIQCSLFLSLNLFCWKRLLFCSINRHTIKGKTGRQTEKKRDVEIGKVNNHLYLSVAKKKKKSKE